MANPFVLDKKEYKRAVNPMGQYVAQASYFLSVETGKPLDQCKDFVLRSMRGQTGIPTRPGQKPIGDRNIVYLLRAENGDRSEQVGTLMGYIQESLTNKEIIAPTFTTYMDPNIKESLLVAYVEHNVGARGKAKKAEFAATAAKKYDLASFKNREQTGKKLSNNAISGGHVSASTPIFNRTAHSTLTSTCRSTSGYGNANNEKFLNGNRHYWSPDIVVNNIVSIVTHTNYDQLQKVIDKYHLADVSPEAMMTCITDATKLYWSDRWKEAQIYDLCTKLSPIQRQAFVYTGDMFRLMVHNEPLVRNFFKELSTKIRVTPENKPEDSLAICRSKAIPEDNMNLAHQICLAEMKGKGKAYHEMLIGYDEKNPANQDHLPRSPELDTLALTVQHVGKVLDDYTDLIQALWVTPNMPASMAHFPESIRKAALTSDTDSTIFTVQDWVIWYKGEVSFDDEAMAIAASAIFLTSQTITHILAMMSANLGVSEKRLNQIAMKNEYKFDVFVPTQVAKHYFATMSCQEGNVFEKIKKEIKGVHLKSSNAPKKITKAAEELMDKIMADTLACKKISALEVLTGIADIERTITKAIYNGELEYFRLTSIKQPGSYKSEPHQSPYIHHLMWEEVFAPKYGSIAAAPYSCIKVSTTLDNPTDTREWLENMADKEMAKRMAAFMAKYNKKILPMVYLATDFSVTNGMPLELIPVVDVRNMVADLSRIFYLIAETLGFYMLNSKKTRLVSDEY